MKSKRKTLDGSTCSQSNFRPRPPTLPLRTVDDSLSPAQRHCVVPAAAAGGRHRLQHLVADQDVDPVGLLPVHAGDLLRRDAVEQRDLFTQVQQRGLVQVQSSVD